MSDRDANAEPRSGGADPRPEDRGAEPPAPDGPAPETPVPSGFEPPAQVAPEPVREADPVPEPEAPQQAPPQPIEVEPHTSVEAVAEPSAPGPAAPEPGPGPESAPVALEPGTDETLALPPTTAAVEPVSVPSAPPPPQGVPVPFAAPPTETNTGRLVAKLVLGIGGGAALFTSVVVGIWIASMTLTNSMIGEVEDTAAEFIAEVGDEDWDEAYGMLCEDLQDRPVEDYVPEWESWHAGSAQVRPMDFDDVDPVVRLPDGSEIALRVQIEQSADAIDVTVCGWYDVG